MHDRRLNPLLATVYAAEAVPRAANLLSGLCRGSAAPAHGCFDRDHWAWKFRDFPLGMLQASVYPLALLWRFPLPENPYYDNARVLDWISGAFDFTLGRQHRCGALDAFCPNERDPCATLGIAHGLSEAFHLIQDQLSQSSRETFLRALRRACDYCLVREENHAFVSNHWALFAVAFHNAHVLLGDEKYGRRAEQVIERILAEQSGDGWYREYDGPDPGYESLGIFHLATYWRRTRSPELLESLRRSVGFYAHCVHPDGSVGGVYGSRHTSLYFPGGFELLAKEIPLAASVANFMRQQLGRRNVVTPALSDTENLPPLLYSYLEACLAPGADRAATPPLPHEQLEGVRHFSQSQISVAGTARYYAVVNIANGGVCRVFDKQQARIAYEDAGYVVRAGGRVWSSQLGLGFCLGEPGPRHVTGAANLAQPRQELPTPAKFVLLRLLNLSLFRSPRLGNWVRRLIIQRLILNKRACPLRLRRKVTFETDEIIFQDVLEKVAPLEVEEVMLPRAFTAIHMGSANYFHPAELESTPLAPVLTMVDDLQENGAAEIEFRLRFSSAEGVELTVETDAADALDAEAIHDEAVTHP